MKAISNNFNEEIQSIDEKISAHKEQINMLGVQRRKLLEKLQHVDMDIVLQCIEEKGLSSNRVLELINNAEDHL